jgi:two-component system chemotaxis response regulator CheB
LREAVLDYPRAHRDIVVLGASAGGLEVLRRLMRDLPADLPASLFVVLHMGSTSHLSHILDRLGPLPVVRAENGMTIEPGRVYVAVPDRHLLLHDNHILLRRGPRENRSRPAVDPLFRSAAASFGGRVIGVVLSGSLADGTAGLMAIKRCGGIAVVQDPVDALVPDMPRSALHHVEVDHVVSIGGLAQLLSQLTREPAGATPDTPLDIRLEAAIAAQELADMKTEDTLGTPSRFTCPECHGALWEIDDRPLLRYRCHVGHAYSADDVLASQHEEVDRLLGTLLRSHHERAALARRMANHERSEGRAAMADRLEARANAYDEDVRLVQSLVRNGGFDGEVLTNREERGAPQHEQES